MAELKVEMWPIERCIPYCRNPRKNDEQVDRMASAIKEFGFRIPIVAKSDGSLVDGHLRLKAAQKLGLKEVPVALADELTEAQVKAFRILANKSANWAEWEPDLLKLELQELQELDFDLELTGFELPELEDILGEGAGGGTEGQTDPDAVPEAQEEPVSRLGDVWLLGRHRLMCGDSTDAGSVAMLMAGEKADMVFTDPPYNVAGESKNFAVSVSKAYENLSEAEWDKGFDIHPALERIGENLASDASVYVCTSHFLAPDIWAWMKGWADFHGYCVWSKPNPMPSLAKRHWTWNTELVCYATKGKHVFNFPDEGHALSTWTINKQNGDSGHPTEKPVAVPEHAILHSSAEGQTVLDLFGGSGSTLIACEKTGRVCRMMELAPRYVDVIVRRWQDFTGQEATLEDGGRTFARVKEERGG